MRQANLKAGGTFIHQTNALHQVKKVIAGVRQAAGGSLLEPEYCSRRWNQAGLVRPLTRGFFPGKAGSQGTGTTLTRKGSPKSHPQVRPTLSHTFPPHPRPKRPSRNRFILYFKVLKYSKRSATCWSSIPRRSPSGIRERLETAWD